MGGGGGGGLSLGPGGLAKERGKQYQGRTTAYVIITCILASVGGSLFGYDVGISGGVASMDEFLHKFFYEVYLAKNGPPQPQTNYCKYSDLSLAAFTSSLYLSGLVASLAASPITKRYGRRISILSGGLTFLVGAALNAAAANLPMLLLGRIMLGLGIGFGNQAVPLYLSEMAPARIRGGVSMLFQLATTVGILTANMVNYGAVKIHPWGWRLSLGLAAAPAFVVTAAGALLPETPNSLIERGRRREGRQVLERIRGTENVDAEFEDIVDASKTAANAVQNPFRDIIERRNRPQLALAILMPAFQIMTGINAVLFYAPAIFESMGFQGNASLSSSALTAAVLVAATLVSMAAVDRLGRRVLLIAGGIQMIVCQIIVAAILGVKLEEERELGKGYGVVVVAAICMFVAAFGWSWGPLGWTVPGEIFPLEIRSAGQSITVAVNLLFTFVVAQSFPSLLCAFKYGIFLFFSGWVVVMTVFVYFLLPETKGVALEEMGYLWRNHWFWKRFVSEYHGQEEAEGD